MDKKEEKQEETLKEEITEIIQDDSEKVKKLDVLLKELQKRNMTVQEISEKLDIAKEDVWPFLDELRSRGFEVEENNRWVFLKREPVPGRITKLPKITKSTVKILVLSDLGLGLKTQQGDLLATAYKIAEEEQVYFALITNISAGKPKKQREREHIYELLSFEEQVQYVIDKLPKASFNTYILNGPRDLSFMSGKNPQNFALAVAEARDDVRYLGDEQAVIEVKNSRIALTHVGDDSTVYTKSYPAQGIIENYQEAIKYVFDGDRNPNIVLVGGLYSMFEMPPRLPLSKERKNNIYGFAVPGLHSITTSQRIRKKRGGSPVLGCLILTLEFNRDGSLRNVIPDWRDLTAYQKKRDYLEEVEIRPDLTNEEKKILELIIDRPRTRGDLSRRLHKSIPHIEEIINGLCRYGYSIIFDRAQKKYKILRGLEKEFKPLSLQRLYFRTAKVTSASDPHLGSVHGRPDLVREVYRISEERKVEKIFWSGDIFCGEDAYFGHRRELIYHGVDAQRDHALEIFPNSEIPSEFIMGSSHELVFWQRCGHNIVETFCKIGSFLNKNLKYIALPNIHNKGLSEVNNIKFQLIHPKGGIPYGASYRLQIIIERLVAIMERIKGEKVLLCGHFHIAAFLMYKGMAGFLVPALQEETQYLVGGGHIPWLGCWIIEISQDEYGNITRIVPEYIAFEPRKN